MRAPTDDVTEPIDQASIGGPRKKEPCARDRVQCRPPDRLASGTGTNPDGVLDTHFTDAAAWELIASRLEDGHPVEVVELRKPAGATGYVMKIDVEPGQPLLYVKLQLGSGRIIGRSFHYSKHGD